jgi:tellurium resistance protein TerD
MDSQKQFPDKNKYDLSRITVGLGWKMKEKKTSILSRLFFDDEDEYDLDAIAFLLDKNDRVSDLGRELKLTGDRRVPFQRSDIIYFHNLTAPQGNLGAYHNLGNNQIVSRINRFIKEGEYIIHTGDNLVGSSDEDSDAEQIIIIPDKVPERIHKILFLVTINDGRHKKQYFDEVDNLYIRLIDKKQKEIVKYSFQNDKRFEGMCAMIFGELGREDNEWYFLEKLEFFETDNFVDILRRYSKVNVGRRKGN